MRCIDIDTKVGVRRGTTLRFYKRHTLSKIREECDIKERDTSSKGENSSSSKLTLVQVKEIIETDNDLEVWKGLGADNKTLEKRKKELDKFLTQISTEREKPKRRVRPKFEFEMINLVNAIAPDNLKKLDEFENMELFKCIELEEKLEDKAVPQKPIPHGDGTNFRCPSCKNCMLTPNNRQSYSMCCGQALDWD